MKRADPNEDRYSRVKKAFGVAVGVTAGAFLLKDRGDLKSISKAFGDIGRTMSKVSDDLSKISFKDLDAGKIDSIIRTRFTNEDSTYRTLKKQVNRIDLGHTQLENTLKKLIDISEDKTNLPNKIADNVLSGEILKKMQDSFKDESREFFEQTDILAKEVLNKRNQFFELDSNGLYKAVNDEFELRLNNSLFKDKEEGIVNIIEEAINNAEDIKNKVAQDYEGNLKSQLIDNYKNEIIDKYSKDDDFFKNTLDRAATVGDFLKAVNEKRIDETDEVSDLYSFLTNAKEKFNFGDEFDNLRIDSKNLRMSSDNELYSMRGFNKVKDTLKEEIADTIPGKLFAMRSRLGNSQVPDMLYMGQGTYDKILANLEGEESGLLKSDHFKIGDKIFRYKDGELKHLKEADDLYFVASAHGQQSRLMNRLFGNEMYRNTKNPIAEKFDLGTVGISSIEGYKSKLRKFKKDSKWYPKVVDRLFDETYDNVEANPDLLVNYGKDLRLIHKMYDDQTYAPTKKTFNALRKVASKDSLKIIDSINDEDLAGSLLKNVKKETIKNKDLASLLRKYELDKNVVDSFMHIGDEKGFYKGKNILTYNQLLKREAMKEILLRESAHSSYDLQAYSHTAALIRDLQTTGAEKKNALNLFNWTIFQKEADLYSKTLHQETTRDSKMERYKRINHLLKTKRQNAQEQAFLESFQNGLKTFAKEHSSMTDTVSKVAEDVMREYPTNSYSTMRKTISPLDIIRNANDSVRLNATGKKFFKQFVAGRNDVENVTTATLIPFHMINRLTTPLETIGAGFSSKATGSVVDLTKNIALKRVLPVAAALYGYSYLNDEARNITGTSLSAAFQNTKSTFTLGVKTVQDTFGLHDFGRRQRMYNPIAQYWGGDYKDKDEYLDYLEYGYDPVRKGRYWSFGSNSEFRGTKIAYWKPNDLRLAHSNYYDESVYGGSNNKWAHSLIPTPTHPLSTIRYLMNPYWLEDMHYEDRPYPVTGKMFQEGTPWGAVLNPTVGRIIKPQKEMHKAELRGGLKDVRSIIAERNQAIKDQATENNIVRLNGNGFTPMAFRPESQPSLNEAVFNIQVNNGKVTSAGFIGQDYAEGLGNLSTLQYSNQSTNGVGTQIAINSTSSNLNTQQKTTANALSSFVTGIVSSGNVSKNTALGMIQQVNQSITDSAESKKAGIYYEKGNLQTSPIVAANEKIKTDYLESVMDSGSKNDYVQDLMYSAKELGGMYGFLFDQILPGKKTYQLDQAGKINSFTDRFWDISVGGLGGDFMEIARRFFPHENHDIDRINPIRNTMPEWLPGRFQTGDPYTKVPLGDARLPGRGYESLNALHPDEYGRYGAFDRYKILADIAPNTEEYKTWKKIATQNIKDPFLLKQMEQIEKRVTEQTKEHDFYNYKFIGKKLDNHNAVIEDVNDDGTFKIIGDPRQYSLAGITPIKQQDGSTAVKSFLQPGMKVNLKYEDNDIANTNSKGSISTLVYSGGESVTKEMFEKKLAKENSDKETLADEYFALTDSNISMGHVWEAIGHAPIPYIHNKFLKIDSPLEAYKKEQVYGTNYATWDHPIKGFIKPTFQEVWGRGPAYQVLGLSTLALSMKANKSGSETFKHVANTAFALTNPGGFAGGIIGALPRMNISSNNSRIGWNAKNFSQIGAAVGAIGYGFANLENPLLSVGNFAVAGGLISKQLYHEVPQGALIGAAIGFGLSSAKTGGFKKMSKNYIPKDTKKKWEVEEYYDRLEYVKYMNLYKQAARKAKHKEHVDVAKIINKFEYSRDENVDKIRKLQEQKKKAEKRILDENLRTQTIEAIEQQIKDLQTPEQYFQMGKYTKAALAYKKAADTTIYGLSEYSSTADVLRALPKYDRDFFLEFAKEKDPKARKKILNMVSPYKRKALKVLWKEDKVDKDVESNRKFFAQHKLPNLFWSGWNPEVDLDNVKIKTIENEGMLLSDFGMYESQKNEPAAMMAPEINDIHDASRSTLSMQKNLLALLNGVGLRDVDVVVEPSSQSGLNVITNITNVATYTLNKKVENVLYQIF